jgi:hypothetical protein
MHAVSTAVENSTYSLVVCVPITVCMSRFPTNCLSIPEWTHSNFFTEVSFDYSHFIIIMQLSLLKLHNYNEMNKEE